MIVCFDSAFLNDIRENTNLHKYPPSNYHRCSEVDEKR